MFDENTRGSENRIHCKLKTRVFHLRCAIVFPSCRKATCQVFSNLLYYSNQFRVALLRIGFPLRFLPPSHRSSGRKDCGLEVKIAKSQQIEASDQDIVEMNPFKFIDLFAGMGGMRIPFQQLGGTCVFSSEWDKHAQRTYYHNFGETPAGDITKIDAAAVPDHDILLAGFPCQPFSIIGDKHGFEDTRGTLFFDIARILKQKSPPAFLLENVKQLVSHNNGKTFAVIQEKLSQLGYTLYHEVLNALDFGLPQKRERVFIVGFREPIAFNFPNGVGTYKPLSEILEPDEDVDPKLFASEHIRKSRQEKCKIDPFFPSVWHENKGGNISVLPFSCALRAGASYNYLLVNGIRRFSGREMLRLQGFPENFKIVVNMMQLRKQTGNSVAIPVVHAIAEKMLQAIQEQKPVRPQADEQLTLFENSVSIHA